MPPGIVSTVTLFPEDEFNCSTRLHILTSTRSYTSHSATYPPFSFLYSFSSDYSWLRIPPKFFWLCVLQHKCMPATHLSRVLRTLLKSTKGSICCSVATQKKKFSKSKTWFLLLFFFLFYYYFFVSSHSQNYINFTEEIVVIIWLM